MSKNVKNAYLTVKKDIFVGKKFPTFSKKPFVQNSLISYLAGLVDPLALKRSYGG